MAGAKVGVVEELEVHKTGDRTFAAIVMRIDEEGFKDFREDAKCAIRLQSVIGEKLIECTPTQPRGAGRAAASAAREDPRRAARRGPVPAAGREHGHAGRRRPDQQHPAAAVPGALLDPPERARHRARRARRRTSRSSSSARNPALKEFDEFLKILADQNKELEALTKNADTVLTALAPRARRASPTSSSSRGSPRRSTAEKRARLRAQPRRSSHPSCASSVRSWTASTRCLRRWRR